MSKMMMVLTMTITMMVGSVPTSSVGDGDDIVENDDIGDGDEKPLQFSVDRGRESLQGPDFSSSLHLPSLWPGKPELPLSSPSPAST